MNDVEFRKNVARRLRYFRKLKGVTAKQMSVDIGKNPSYISRIEGENIIPSVESFFDIVRYIGVTGDFFFKAKL